MISDNAEYLSTTNDDRRQDAVVAEPKAGGGGGGIGRNDVPFRGKQLVKVGRERKGLYYYMGVSSYVRNILTEVKNISNSNNSEVFTYKKSC